MGILYLRNLQWAYLFRKHYDTSENSDRRTVKFDAYYKYTNKVFAGFAANVTDIGVE